MRLKYPMLLVVVLVFFVITACSKKPDREEDFIAMYEGFEMNESITIEPDEQDPNNLRTNGHTTIVILRNDSSGDFLYKPEVNCKILHFDNQQDQWVEVPNTIEYHRPNSSENIIVRPSSVILGGEDILIYRPTIPDLKSDILLRFVVTGTIIESNGDESQAGAYVDVVISP